VAIHDFESLREPTVFAIHSEWWTKLRWNYTRSCRTRFDF
jgi:hypothetical protein